MKLLRQSTAQILHFGPMVDAGDGVTLETGLATAMDNATTGLRVSKDGGAFIDRNSSTVPAYDAMGDYLVTLDVTDTATVGMLRVIFEEAATCLPHWEDYMVVDAGYYDAVTGVTPLATTAAVTSMGANTITAASVAVGAIAADAFVAGAIDAAAIATGAIDADSIAADAITAAKIATDAIGSDELSAGAVSDIQSGLSTAAALATVDANVDIMVSGIITGAAVTGTLSTTQATTDLTGYTADQLIGRLVTWTSGACDGEQTDITDYVVTGGELTFTAMTLAPANTDTFKIT